MTSAEPASRPAHLTTISARGLRLPRQCIAAGIVNFDVSSAAIRHAPSRRDCGPVSRELPFSQGVSSASRSATAIASASMRSFCCLDHVDRLQRLRNGFVALLLAPRKQASVVLGRPERLS